MTRIPVIKEILVLVIFYVSSMLYRYTLFTTTAPQLAFYLCWFSNALNASPSKMGLNRELIKDLHIESSSINICPVVEARIPHDALAGSMGRKVRTFAESVNHSQNSSASKMRRALVPPALTERFVSTFGRTHAMFLALHEIAMYNPFFLCVFIILHTQF